jgi:hypothetical protein
MLGIPDKVRGSITWSQVWWRRDREPGSTRDSPTYLFIYHSNHTGNHVLNQLLVLFSCPVGRPRGGSFLAGSEICLAKIIVSCVIMW